MRTLTLLLALLVGIGTSASAQTAVVEYYHVDAVGSVRAVTNQAGQVVRTHNYFAFGDGPDPAPPSNQDPLRFTGKPRDAETGLDYFGARHYRARNGRFTTVDPFLDTGAAITNPQRWNRYAYGLNNPLRNGDPDGRDTIDLVIGFGQGIWSTAKGIVTLPYALATDPGAVATGFVEDFRLIGYGIKNPGQVLDAYVGLSVSANDADQRALGAAFGQSTAFAALTVAPFAKSAPRVTQPYRRPSGATTAEQRAAVQGKPCIDCGAVAPKMFANHTRPLVKEYYETGTINTTRMRDVRSVTPHCPTCSAKEGAALSRYSAAKKKEINK